MYNDNKYGFQIARLQGIKYTGDTLEGKSGYNNLVETLNSKCQKYMYAGNDTSNSLNEGVLGARAGGSNPSFVESGNELYSDVNRNNNYRRWVEASFVLK